MKDEGSLIAGSWRMFGVEVGSETPMRTRGSDQIAGQPTARTNHQARPSSMSLRSTEPLRFCKKENKIKNEAE